MYFRKLTASFRRHAKHLAQDRSGAYVIITALALPAVVGSFGFMSEVATWYSAKQLQQDAADSAAISAAIALSAGESSLIATARGISGKYGYVNNDSTVRVSFNSPPATGPNSTNKSAVEVIIQVNQPATFSTMFGMSGLAIKARSVAIAGSSTSACVLALGTNVVNELIFQGNVSMNFEGCSINGNAPNSQSMYTGGSVVVKAGAVKLAGGLYGSATPTTTSPDGISQYGAPTPDPYATRNMPMIPSSCDYTNFKASGTVTLNPGIYCGGITIASNANVTLNPGVYYMASGSLSMTSTNAVVTGTGVTFVFTTQSGASSYAVATVTGGTFNVTAPTTGAMAGIVMYQDRNAPQLQTFKMTGGAGLTLGGAVYLPQAALTFSGGASTTGCTQLVANALSFSGTTNLALKCSGYGVSTIGGSPLALAE